MPCFVLSLTLLTCLFWTSFPFWLLFRALRNSPLWKGSLLNSPVSPPPWECKIMNSHKGEGDPRSFSLNPSLLCDEERGRMEQRKNNEVQNGSNIPKQLRPNSLRLVCQNQLLKMDEVPPTKSWKVYGLSTPAKRWSSFVRSWNLL